MVQVRQPGWERGQRPEWVSILDPDTAEKLGVLVRDLPLLIDQVGRLVALQTAQVQGQGLGGTGVGGSGGAAGKTLDLPITLSTLAEALAASHIPGVSARPVLQQTVIPAGTTQADAVSTAYTVTTGAHAVIIGRWSVQWSIPDPNLLWSLIVNQNGVGQSVLTPAPLTGDADFQGDSSLFASLDISQNVTVSAYGPNTSQDITMTLTLTAIEITTAVWTSLVAPLLTIQQPAWLRQLAGGA